MGPQPRWVGVHRVERDPREGTSVGVRCRPLGKERRLAVTRRSTDERERPLPPAAQPLDESWALEQTVLDMRGAELGRDDVRRPGDTPGSTVFGLLATRELSLILAPAAIRSSPG